MVRITISSFWSSSVCTVFSATWWINYIVYLYMYMYITCSSRIEACNKGSCIFWKITCSHKPLLCQFSCSSVFWLWFISNILLVLLYKCTCNAMKSNNSALWEPRSLLVDVCLFQWKSFIPVNIPCKWTIALEFLSCLHLYFTIMGMKFN